VSNAARNDLHPAVLGTIADYAVALVTALGPDTVFSLTGGMAMHLNRAVAAQPGLRAIYCQHEQAAVAAAEGYACASDFRRPGFAVVTSGPGVANTVTALLSANGDSAPLIVLAGQIKTADIDALGLRTHGPQEVPSEAFVTPCVKRFQRLSKDRFREELVETLAQAIGGRPGPVVIEFPLDVQGAPIAAGIADVEEDLQRVRSLALSEVIAKDGAHQLAAVFDQLMSAGRPLLYVGNGCRIAGAEAWIRAFIDATGTPAVFSWLSYDILPANHPLHFGCPGGLAPISSNRILGEADEIVFLGARLDLGTTAFQRDGFGAQARRTFIDVDARELRKFADLPNCSALNLDLRALPETAIPAAKADPAWASWCRRQHRSELAEEHRRLSSGALSVYNICERLSGWCAGRVVVPACSGYAAETFSRFFQPPEDGRIFCGAALGAMGFGLPMALGAAFATPKPVICADADGGLMLNIQELATLRSAAPRGFILFIMNNDGYESIRLSQTRHFNGQFGADNSSGVWIPSFQALSGAFGLPYLRVETLKALEEFLDGHSASAPPVVVELMIGRSEPRGPAVRTVMHADGRIASTPLQDIDW
jgi:acetolactate synthase-1/2/3 large subunit